MPQLAYLRSIAVVARHTPPPHSVPASGNRPRVAIVGCGASGAMVAIELVRRRRTVPTDLVIVESRAELGRGLAYSTGDPLHLLNVRAAAMSAIESEPGHLLHWARRQGLGVSADTFLPRHRFGDYLEETLAEHLRRHEDHGTVRFLRDRVTAVDLGRGGRPRLRCAGGAELEVDDAVLALGHGRVREPAAVPADLAESGRYISLPWNREPRELAGDGESVLLIGSGLTMVDAALSIAAAALGVRMTSVSRSGLLPRAHRPQPAPSLTLFPLPAEPGIEPLMAEFRAALARAEVAGGGAADVIDSMRPVTQRLWHRLPEPDRAWFLRHLRRDWEVLRHRMAPGVAARIEALRADGTLAHRRAGLERLELGGSKVLVHLGTADGPRTLAFDRIVNCAGPGDDFGGPEGAPLDGMLADGTALRDRLGLGLEVTLDGALVGVDGPQSQLHAIGPVRKGSLWESTAIPELRRQASELAATIVGAGRRAPVAALA